MSVLGALVMLRFHYPSWYFLPTPNCLYPVSFRVHATDDRGEIPNIREHCEAVAFAVAFAGTRPFWGWLLPGCVMQVPSRFGLALCQGL